MKIPIPVPAIVAGTAPVPRVSAHEKPVPAKPAMSVDRQMSQMKKNINEMQQQMG